MKVLSSVSCLVLSIAALSPAMATDRFDDALRMIVASPAPLETANHRGFAVREGRIQIVAVASENATSELEGWLRARGALHITTVKGRVQAFVPPSVLFELEEHPAVIFVERPIYGALPEPDLRAAVPKLTTLAVTSEGVAAMNAPAWNAEGTTGEGVSVGVIDLQFGGWEELVGVELPPAERTTYRAFGGASAVADEVHGTACAEIVHDIAPDAHLFLAHVSTLNDFFTALEWLTGEGVDVATMSVGWFGTGPGDGTGGIAEEITAFIAASDALFLTSAGNERRSHWQGESIDGDANDWVDFAPGDDLNELSLSMSAGDRVAVNIVWDDWDAPSADYSLHLFNLDGVDPVEVALSDRAQSGQGWQSPFETISYTAPDGGRFGVRIGRAGVVGTNDIELFSLDSDLTNRVAEGSLTIPSDSADVVTIAAINYNAPYAYRSFSSAGPANGPGGTLSGGEVKPDLSGYDGVSTVSYGTRGFFGTSSASPHAAGAAALVRDANPGFDYIDTRVFLESEALNLGPTGKDNDTGWGRVFLGQTPGSTCTFSLSPTEASVSSAGGGGIIQVTTDEGCPWQSSSLADWLTVAPAMGTSSGVAGFTADANPASTPRTGVLTIGGVSFVISQAGAVIERSYLVAGIAETEGAAQTRWKSDLAILNPGGSQVQVALEYRHDQGTSQATVSVEPGGIVELANVAAETFGVPNSAGAVRVTTLSDLIVTARTYNDAPDGTYGQFLPGVAEGDGSAASDVAVLSQLTSGSGFRTNVGFVDLGGGGAVVRVRLFDGSGSPVGSDLAEVVPAGGWFQRNRVFQAAGVGGCSGCYALVDLAGGQGPVWAYASVVDNSSGDPTTIPESLIAEEEISNDERYLVAGIAETDGANQTKWKSNLALLNLSGQGVTADLTYRYDGGSGASSVTLADGELREFSNIAVDLFGVPGSAGAVDVDGDGPLVVTARTFNESSDGTFGQFLPGFGDLQALASGVDGFLSQLKSTDDFRTNIGFTNYGESECTARVMLYDEVGVQKGTLYSAVPAGGWTQLNKVFNAAGVDSCPLGYAVVRVLTPNCRVWAYGSVVDNASGDPTTVPVVVW